MSFMFNYRKPMTSSERSLTRDVAATLVPAGDAVNLPAGTQVTITHRLGGNFTVVCDYGMFRINGADADALGERSPARARSRRRPSPARTPRPPSRYCGKRSKRFSIPRFP